MKLKSDKLSLATSGAHIAIGDQKKRRLDHIEFSSGEGNKVSLILCDADGQTVTVTMSRKLFIDNFYFWLDRRVSAEVRKRHDKQDARAQRKYELDCWQEIADAIGLKRVAL